MVCWLLIADLDVFYVGKHCLLYLSYLTSQWTCKHFLEKVNVHSISHTQVLVDKLVLNVIHAVVVATQTLRVWLIPAFKLFDLTLFSPFNLDYAFPIDLSFARSNSQRNFCQSLFLCLLGDLHVKELLSPILFGFDQLTKSISLLRELILALIAIATALSCLFKIC